MVFIRRPPRAQQLLVAHPHFAVFHFHRPGAYCCSSPSHGQPSRAGVSAACTAGRSPPARRRRPPNSPRDSTLVVPPGSGGCRGRRPARRRQGTCRSLSGRRSPPAPEWRQGRIPPATVGMGVRLRATSQSAAAAADRADRGAAASSGWSPTKERNSARRCGSLRVVCPHW